MTSKPFVVTVFDMIDEVFGNYYRDGGKTSARKRHIVHAAQRVIAISERTKKDLVQYFQADESRIDVIPLASSLSRVVPKHPPVPLSSKFLLYVGERRGYKNFRVFLDAISPTFAADSSLQLVCAGGTRFTDEELHQINALEMKSRVVHLSPTDAELSYLYRNATLFVLPSLYEGFGIPLVEAQSCRCPALVSDIDVFHEIADDTAEFFDPRSATSIRLSVEGILANDVRRQQLSLKGVERSKRFSWLATAQGTARVYERVLS
jgi:glycosyltransferase involved in cell wall biosynthesis